MKKICIITPGILASNPRVVKEAAALSEAGYQVHLIYTRHVNYLISNDEEILNEHPEWTVDYLDWASNTFQARKLKFLSGITRRILEMVVEYSLIPESSTGKLVNRFYFWQLKEAIAQKADLYIAHYPDSIAVAAEAAKTNKSLFAFDAEDYHRGENLPLSVTKAITSIEDQYLCDAVYISAASPMIAEAYQKHYPAIRVFPVENMFPLKKQTPFRNLYSRKYKFFWFSQTIGSGRGLEEFIDILSLCITINFQLTLLGNVSDTYKTELQDKWLSRNLKAAQLIFLKTVAEGEIFKIASEHHFGLCLEIPTVLNKDLCLSNKLYTYILSGNYLILSNTKAQYQFHDSFPDSGIKIDLENSSVAAAKLLHIIEYGDLNNLRHANFDLGKKALNFDVEKHTLLKHIASI